MAGFGVTAEGLGDTGPAKDRGGKPALVFDERFSIAGSNPARDRDPTREAFVVTITVLSGQK